MARFSDSAIMALSSMGLPGLNGFIGEFLILIGSFEWNPVYTYWAVWGIVLGAAYLLWLFQRVMFGEVKDDKIAALRDLNLREIATLLPLAVLAVWIGLAPNAVLKTIEPPVNAIIERVHPGYFDGSDITPPPLPSIPGPELAADIEPTPTDEPLASSPDAPRKAPAEGD